MNNTKHRGRGRPDTVLSAIRRMALQLPHLTDKEVALKLMENQEFRKLLKGGLDGDLRRQVRSVYIAARKYRTDAVAVGKKVAFTGRLNKDGKMVSKWMRAASLTRTPVTA